MLKNYYQNILGYGKKIASKIAFFPSILSILGMLFAFVMYYLENKGVSGYLIEHVPILVINSTDTAYNILTAFIAGLISIMVFSFSMVMILLNQASSNFSPRVLPGLISNKRHQIILGIYNASLLYFIFTLVAIEPTGNDYQTPGFSVLIAIVLMTVCLGSFIYFIHSISQEIQVHNIMQRIHGVAKKRLEKLIKSEESDVEPFPNTSNWTSHTSKKSGFLQDIILEPIITYAMENDCVFEIIPIKGTFIHQNSKLFKVNVDIDEDTEKELLSYFHFSRSELIEDNYILGFKQITEIAVKAMSPGINDPGTAIIAIDYLTELFYLRMQKSDISQIVRDNRTLAKINTINFKELFYYVLAALRTYVKHDVIIVLKMLSMLEYLAENANEERKAILLNQVQLIYNDAKESISNTSDVELISNKLKLFDAL